MAQIIIAKHRKGATGDVLLTFRGEFTRFENPEDSSLRPMPANEGEIVGSRINGGDSGAADFTPYNPTDIPPMDGPMPF